MARPKKNNVEYFPHTVTHGKKMSYIEKKYKNDGYATWFKILEELGNTDNHYLNLSDDVQIMFLSDKCLISEGLLIDIINDLVRLKEFDAELWNDNKIIYCEKFTDSIEDAYSKRKNDCINKDELIQLLIGLGVRKLNKSSDKPNKSSQSGVKKPQSKVEYTKVNKTKKERVSDFTKSLLPFVNDYKKEMLREFCDYWTEHSDKDKKLRWEKQTSFSVKRRLLTWHNQDYNKHKNESTLSIKERTAHISNNINKTL